MDKFSRIQTRNLIKEFNVGSKTMQHEFNTEQSGLKRAFLHDKKLLNRATNGIGKNVKKGDKSGARRSARRIIHKANSKMSDLIKRNHEKLQNLKRMNVDKMAYIRKRMVRTIIRYLKGHVGKKSVVRDLLRIQKRNFGKGSL